MIIVYSDFASAFVDFNYGKYQDTVFFFIAFINWKDTVDYHWFIKKLKTKIFIKQI